MKPLCHFHFMDEPQFRAHDSRAHVAHLLRAYRSDSRRFSISRVSSGMYHVRMTGHSVTAVIETK
jgi:hypothetical protein